MKSRRKMRLKRTDIVAFAIAAALAVLSFLPASWMPVGLFSLIGGDKAAHVVAYAVLGVFALYGRRRFATAFLTMIGILYFGGLIELFQADLKRTTDIADFAANGVGLAMASVVVAAWKTLSVTPQPRRARQAHRA